MHRSLSLAAVLGCSLLLSAQKPTEAATAKAGSLTAVWQTYTTARDAMQTQMKELSGKARSAKDDEQKELMAKMNDLRKQVSSAQEAFQKAFAASEWQKLDATKDAGVLKDGLPGLIRDDATTPAKNIEACEFYLAHFGSEPMAKGIRGNALPYALLAAGKSKEAILGLDKWIATLAGAEKARALMTLGDVNASQGDLAAANKAYADAGAAADAEKDEKAAKSVRGYIDLRTALIGKPAPDIDSATWIDGTATPLSKLTGKVVLVDFWATWCGPCRMVMPKIDAMYREHQKDGLTVMGVTKVYPNGYLPANKEQTLSGGENVPKIAAGEFQAHVEAFKKNTGISYPFVIGKDEDFKNYKVTGIPTLIVVGKDGKVALVCVGSGSEPLLKAAVAHLLAQK